MAVYVCDSFYLLFERSADLTALTPTLLAESSPSKPASSAHPATKSEQATSTHAVSGPQRAAQERDHTYGKSHHSNVTVHNCDTNVQCNVVKLIIV